MAPVKVVNREADVGREAVKQDRRSVLHSFNMCQFAVSA